MRCQKRKNRGVKADETGAEVFGREVSIGREADVGEILKNQK